MVDQAEYIKSRFGKEVSVIRAGDHPVTGILKRWVGLASGTPSLLLDRHEGGMVWVDVNPPGSILYTGRV